MSKDVVKEIPQYLIIFGLARCICDGREVQTWLGVLD